MNTGYLIDEYYVGPFKIQKRAVCGVGGNLLTYSYEAYGKNVPTYMSDEYLSEKEALEVLFNRIKNKKEDVDKEFNEISKIISEYNEK